MDRRSKASNDEALFEDDYVLRTLGRIGYDPETALAELVANAWDAGASKVKVIIPTELDGLLTVEDDGHGMTKEEFTSRWMKLGYNRHKAQGDRVHFPPDRSDWVRQAFGRNGIGRHGLLCFASQYTVETWTKGKLSRYVIGTENRPTSPFYIVSESHSKKNGHGTRLAVEVRHHLPKADSIRHVLSARFLHDPRFVVEIDGVSIPLSEHKGLIESEVLNIAENYAVTANVVDATSSGRSNRYQGIAFWINNRLVGMPSWTVGSTATIDGRSRFAKRHAIVIQGGDSWLPQVEGDWSRFKKTEITEALFAAVNRYATSVFDKLSSCYIEEQSEDALMRNRESFRDLSNGAKLEVARFAQELAQEQPGIQPESLNQAVKAVIRLQQARSGSSLLDRLMQLDDQDIDGLDRMLEQWSVQDALTVLDEIDSRLSVITAIEKLGGDKSADELHTLHPLVTQARWLFGPEFDSSEFASNNTLRTAAKKIFNSKIEDMKFANPRKRPDLVALNNSTMSIVGTESFDSNADHLCTVRDVLLIELKKGYSTIGKEEAYQANSYVQDFIADGGIAGAPFFHAFVVGHTIAKGFLSRQELKDGQNQIRGTVICTTYSQLTDTANHRLHGLKARIPSKYEDVTGFSLVKKIMGTETQASLLPENSN
ncbi:ATP-binding protein [Xanthomonas campestris pv. raphani]|uniref:ATP-binding protein n=1 Tax=Xanthomonas campestris TaxID=339 RepID=UPI002B232728|nr:ATP-binding protein [Xanthomonas campestris]MEA9751487.1 ATP-binding protein [Xanthomonas campestris pv. raphani]MEA9811354.1 ATP-binding protein [Xanthomonas campestris pv. raphani]